MFEERAISLWTYNLETLLAEKLETIMARGIANTRMRDFYDIHVIRNQEPFDRAVLKKAFLATSDKRNTTMQISDFKNIFSDVEADETMKKQWERFKEDSFWASIIRQNITESLSSIFCKLKLESYFNNSSFSSLELEKLE